MSLNLKKIPFELLFHVINTKEDNLFTSDEAYPAIRKRYTIAKRTLRKNSLEQIRKADFYIKALTVFYHKDISSLMVDAECLLTCLKKERVKKVSFLKIWNSIVLRTPRKWMYLIEDFKDDDDTCAAISHLEQLIQYSEVVENIKMVSKLWQVEAMDFSSLAEEYGFLEDITECAREALIAYERGMNALDEMIHASK